MVNVDCIKLCNENCKFANFVCHMNWNEIWREGINVPKLKTTCKYSEEVFVLGTESRIIKNFYDNKSSIIQMKKQNLVASLSKCFIQWNEKCQKCLFMDTFSYLWRNLNMLPMKYNIKFTIYR